MKYLVFIFIFISSFNSLADYEGYDEIIDKLSKYKDENTNTAQVYRPEVRSFSRAHIGIGVAQTFFDADAVSLDSRMQNQGGLIINIGVDVLSTRWGVEGSYANFGTQNTNNSEIKLREFSLKGLFKPAINKIWSMRLGLGVSSRFLDISNINTSESYKTPSGLFVFGLESYISQFISVGADIGFKTAMIDETIDRTSVDVAFKVDTHF